MLNLTVHSFFIGFNGQHNSGGGLYMFTDHVKRLLIHHMVYYCREFDARRAVEVVVYEWDCRY